MIVMRMTYDDKIYRRQVNVELNGIFPRQARMPAVKYKRRLFAFDEKR